MFNKGFKSTIGVIFLVCILGLSQPGLVMADSTGTSIDRNVQIAVKVSNPSQQTASDIHIKLPLISADSPYQKTVSETFNCKVTNIKVGEAGSRTADIVIDSLGAGESKTITVDYELEIILGGDDSSSSTADLQQYLKPSGKIASNDQGIAAKAAELTQTATGDLDKINRIGYFVNSHMTYNAASAYRNQGAVSALQHGEGVCEDYAALFVALARAAGVPARQVNGFADPRTTGSSWKTDDKELSLSEYRHAWAEVYIQNEGWIAVDPTFKLYPQDTKDSVLLLSASHIAQNYYDQPINAEYRGQEVSIGWGDLLINK